jgi:hypothetical protein
MGCYDLFTNLSHGPNWFVINTVLLVWRKCLYKNLGCVILSEFPSSHFIRSVYYYMRQSFSPFVECIVSGQEYYMFQILL